MIYFFPFVFGMIIGSFLNVAGYRWNSGLTLGGRSFCPSCGHKLRWFELVPVLSFVFLFGKCGRCASKISWQYPLVEILTGLVFLSVFHLQVSTYQSIGPAFLIHTALLLIVLCLYIVIGIYDFKHKIIPDDLVYPAIFLSAFVPLVSGGALLDWLSGPILFLFFALIWFGSRGRAIGFGDAKLSLSVGWLLGASAGFSAIVLAFWIGALFSLIYIFLGKVVFPKGDKRLTMKSEIPFAPFIILGAWLSLIFQLDILHVSLF